MCEQGWILMATSRLSRRPLREKNCQSVVAVADFEVESEATSRLSRMATSILMAVSSRPRTDRRIANQSLQLLTPCSATTPGSDRSIVNSHVPALDITFGANCDYDEAILLSIDAASNVASWRRTAMTIGRLRKSVPAPETLRPVPDPSR